MIDLLEARLALLTLARPSHVYCRQHSIAWRETEPACGGVYLAPIMPLPGGRFDFAPDGVEAVVCEAIDPDGIEVIDLVAWSADDPARVWTAIGAAAVLGANVAANPATFAFGRPLRLFRTPLCWLKAGCDGIAILDLDRAVRWLIEADVPVLAAEDDAHAAELHAARVRLIQGQRILVPEAA